MRFSSTLRTFGFKLGRSAVGLIAMTVAGSAAAADEATEHQQRFQAAIADAAVIEPSEVRSDLFAIGPQNPDLVWRDHEGRREVLVATWMSRGKLGATFPNASVDTIAAGAVGAAVVGRDIWVTAVPQLRDFCRSLKRTGPALELRLKQYLGLNAAWSYFGLVQLWVDPADLYRPCVDPEIDDSSCGMPQSVVGKYGRSTTDTAYLKWFRELEAVSYGANGAPWTRLGYTYDWGNSDSKVGASEYVIAPNARVTFDSIASPDVYCSGGGDASAVVDVVVTMNNGPEPRPGPQGSSLVGLWDVDAGGGVGTDGSRGEWIAALYVVRGAPSGRALTDLVLTAADAPTPRVVPNFSELARWDADGGGAFGSEGSRGNWSVGLFGRSLYKPACFIADVITTIGNEPLPPPAPAGYRLVGFWDVDRGGAVGTDGRKSGTYMMGLYTRAECRK